jgi:hypothetical protein
MKQQLQDQDGMTVECKLMRGGNSVRCWITAAFNGLHEASDEDYAAVQKAMEDWAAGKKAPCLKSKYVPLPGKDCVLEVGKYSTHLIEIEVAEG